MLPYFAAVMVLYRLGVLAGNRTRSFLSARICLVAQGDMGRAAEPSAWFRSGFLRV